MKIEVMCRAVATTKTKKGSTKIVFVTPDAELFTVYTKDEIIIENLEELETEDIRQFDANVSDIPIFFVKGENVNG